MASEVQFAMDFNKRKRELFDKVFDHLNSEQRKAVYKVNGPLLILAGAGSGKTTVLVNRLMYLIRYGDAYNTERLTDDADEHLYEQMGYALSLPKDQLSKYLTRFKVAPPAPWNVMAITFTNKAANEIKERLSKAFEDDDVSASDIWSGTFHSICMRFLRRWGDLIGYSKDFGICDSDDSKKLITECMKDLKIDTKSYPVRGVMSAISREKDSLRTPNESKEYAGNDAYYRVVSTVYGEYQKRLRSSDLMDFDDIIMQTVRLFSEQPTVLSEVQRKFKYISVDEYQDTNTAQFKLVSLISGGYRNIMAVGDDDQSIYKFRGATIKNILGFDAEYKDATIIKLERNYRSTETILNAANAIIKNNSERKGKNLWTDAGKGDPICVEELENQNYEARYIGDNVERLKESGDFEFRDMAVLYRTNVQSRSIEQSLARSGIPYRMLGSLRFFDRQEIKDIIAYLAVINNPKDNVHLKRIINVPRRNIGTRSVEAVELIAASEDRSMLEIMADSAKYVAIPPAAARSMRALYELLLSLEKSKDEVSALIEKVVETTGYMAMLLKLDKEEGKDRIENVGELVSTAKQYEDSVEEPSLREFLQDVALVSDVDRYDESANAVTLMTIHSAKGLEFPVVFLPGMEEGIFPGYQSIMNPSEIEEERRLAYVAVTRAKKRLFITHARNRMINGSTQYNRRSRFVDEIPDDLYVTSSASAKRNYVFNTSTSTSYSSGRGSFGRTTQRTSFTKPQTGGEIKRSAPVAAFTVGDRVRHSTFGAGTVQSFQKVGADILYVIEFDKVGKKKLMASYARLTAES